MLYFQVYVPFPSPPCLLPFQQDVGQDESVEVWHIVWVQRGGQLVGGGEQVRVGWEGRLPMLPIASNVHPAALWQVLPRLLKPFLGSKLWPQSQKQSPLYFRTCITDGSGCVQEKRDNFKFKSKCHPQRVKVWTLVKKHHSFLVTSEQSDYSRAELLNLTNTTFIGTLNLLSIWNDFVNIADR